MPLFHVHGLVASTLATLATGGTVVVPGKFSPLSFWRIAKEYGATWYSAVPTIHQLLLARVEAGAPKPAGAEKLRFIRSCSASLPPQVMHDLEAAFGAPVLEAYGMTEAAHQMASNPLPPSARKPGAVGPGTNVGISIRDGNGQEVATGERGEVCILGPNVVKGYENNPEANATAFFDGWFRTGDQGYLDAEGYLTLSGRLKEMINRGGEKISPREIDEVLLGHPAVGEAVCFGVPHRDVGRGGGRGGHAQGHRHRGRAARLLQGPARRVQAAEADPHHRGDPADRDRQDPAPRGRPGVRTDRPVKFVIAGAGAIGGYIGAKLARAGADVVLFARGPHLRAMQERGVRVIGAEEQFEVRPPVTGDLATVGQADVVVLGVKAHALTALAPTLTPLFGPDTIVVSTQNGIPWWYFQGVGGELNDLRLERVDPGGVIAGAIEHRRVVGSLAYFATDLAEPGVIRHIEGNRLSLGEPDGSKSERAKRLADALIAAGLRCPVTARFRHEIWVKLLGNVAFNPISALTGGTLEEMARHPEGATLVRALMAETEAVAGRLGIELPISIDQRMAGAEKVGAHKTSMLQDWEAGGRWSSRRWSARWSSSANGSACRCRRRAPSTPCAKLLDEHRGQRQVVPGWTRALTSG